MDQFLETMTAALKKTLKTEISAKLKKVPTYNMDIGIFICGMSWAVN